ncbi:MAG: TauD/TfdA family dioxygenase [Alphaproteobacteria bacterium]|nr:TauD/TfdA family dioxygenase [Alphaproteobacteria bacterium]
MDVELATTGARLGAEIRGVDLTQPVDGATFTAIENAFDEHGVIIFRNQRISPAQQVAFSGRFGEVAINHNGAKYGIEGNPEIYIISNVTENDRPIGIRRAGESWHSDMSYTKRPARATMLYAVEVPQLHGLTLGDTKFANAAAAWNALPESMKRKIEDLNAVFDFRGRKRSRPIDDEIVAQFPPVQHPIVRTHPRTGRKSLYVMRGDCTAIAGMETAEAEGLIAALADHIIRPEFIYRHRWRPGDFVIWDNCTVQHNAVLDYDLPLRRLMWRTTVKGDAPR